MVKFLIQSLSNISAHFQWDLSGRLVQRLRPLDRRFLLWRLLQVEAEEVTFRRNDTLWSGKTWDTNLVLPLFTNGHHHGEEIKGLVKWMRHHGRIGNGLRFIVDVGANIGTTCIPLAQQTDCQLLAIEPVPENFQLLQRNVRENGLAERIQCVLAAVYQGPANLEMLIPSDNCGGAFINRKTILSEDRVPEHLEIRERVTVSADTLTHLLDIHQVAPDSVAFVWSDTEGSESEVIETGTALWEQGVPLYLELCPQALDIQGRLDSIVETIERHFDRYIESLELIRRGKDGTVRPATALPELLTALKQDNGLTDVLLLPIGFPSS